MNMECQSYMNDLQCQDLEYEQHDHKKNQNLIKSKKHVLPAYFILQHSCGDDQQSAYHLHIPK